MSIWARVGIICVLIAGAVLFVSALRAVPLDDVQSGIGGPAQTPPSAADAIVGPEARPGVLDSSRTCQACHPEIYAEWMSDRHSQAWIGKLYTELSNNHQDSTCWSCHAPRPILETGVNSPAETRANRREEGITCLTCHKQGRHVIGPRRDPQATPAVGLDCGPAFQARYPSASNQTGTNEFCGVCHNLHGTCDEFNGSRYAREGKTCLSCHMKEILAPVAKGGEPRVRRVHRMPGGHVPAMLRKAMTLEPRLDGDRLHVRVVNQGAGHRIPTDARHRAIRLFAEFFDSYGQPIILRSSSGRPERAVLMDLIRLFYRQEHKEPTQIDPAGTLGTNNWRESTTPIPEAARGGKVRLRLYYFLRHDWPPHKATLVEERVLDLG